MVSFWILPSGLNAIQRDRQRPVIFILLGRWHDQIAQQSGVISADHLRDHGSSVFQVTIDALQHAFGIFAAENLQVSADSAELADPIEAERPQLERKHDVIVEHSEFNQASYRVAELPLKTLLSLAAGA